MDQPKWLKLSALGFLIVLLGLTYFIVIGRFSSNKPKESVQVPTSVSERSIQIASPSPSPVNPQSVRSPKSAYQMLSDRNLPKAKELPNTGFPTDLVGILAAGAAVIGFGLRRFPK